MRLGAGSVRSLIGALAIILAACTGPAAEHAVEAGAASPTRTVRGEGSLAILPTPTSTGPAAYPEGSALRALLEDGRFTVLVGIIEQGRVGQALALWSDPAHGATIFAPTDAAFRQLDPDLLAALLDDRVVSRVVKNHVLEAPMALAELAERTEVQGLGVALSIDATERLSVAGVPVAEGDIQAGPTVIHVLDDVLIPCHDAFLEGVIGSDLAAHCQGG